MYSVASNSVRIFFQPPKGDCYLSHIVINNKQQPDTTNIPIVFFDFKFSPPFPLSRYLTPQTFVEKNEKHKKSSYCGKKIKNDNQQIYLIKGQNILTKLKQKGIFHFQ